MARVIPNGQVWIGFTTAAPANSAAPTETELDAATNLTNLVASINPTSQGNNIPTPALDSLFDRSIVGTSAGSFTGEFYRDDANDAAWNAMARGTRGFFYISRFGGTGTDKIPRSGQDVETWPVEITQRAASAMTTNQVQMFSVVAAVNEVPDEDAVVAAGSGVPSVPRNVTAVKEASGIIVLDWDAPTSAGASAITGYKVYESTTTVGGSYSEVSTNITKTGTTARISSRTPASTYHYKVAATNATGDSSQSSPGVTVTA